jgi:NTE family protein
MAFVDATIVNIAIPSIAGQFPTAPLSSVSWVLNAYNIVFAAFLVGGGQLADLLGRRRVFSFALVVFTLGSALCALAPSLGLLVAARVVQALGASVLVPSSLAIVLEAHTEQRRQHAIALWSAVAALAAGIGPPLGGLLITADDWRLVFLVNIPIGLLALALAGRVLVESRAPGRRRMPDVVGAFVLTAAIGLLVLAIVKGQEWGWGSASVVGTLLAALLLCVYFCLRSSRHRVPIVDLSLLRVRAFSLANGVTVVMAAGFYAYTLCNVLFLTGVWRYSILTAGLALTPGPFTALAVAALTSRLLARIGHRAILVPGALIWAGGMAFFATQLGVDRDFLGAWLPGMVILGIGAGLTFPTLSGAAVGSVPGPRFAIATSLNSVARQIGAALGVATLIAILGTPAGPGALSAFQHGWLFAGGCFLMGSLVCLALVLPHAVGGRKEQGYATSGIGMQGRAARENGKEGEGGPGVGDVQVEVAGMACSVALLPSLVEDAGEQAAVAPQTIADFLCNVPLFAELSLQLREQIAALAKSVSLARGDWLFRVGDTADAVYVVRLGHIEVLSDGATPATLNTLTRGAVLGELALLSDSVRSASIRALRDSELLRIDRDSFHALLGSMPELAIGLTRTLSRQLQASRAIPVARRPRPVTVALYALDGGVPLLDLADELSRNMCAWGSVAVLYPERAEPQPGADARFAALIERCEQDHDQVLMVCGTSVAAVSSSSSSSSSSQWDDFCLARADRVLVVAAEPTPESTPTSDRRIASLQGADLLGWGVQPGQQGLTGLLEALRPGSVHAVRTGPEQREDIARVARRLTGRSPGVVLSGGGARAFAHLGVLDVLQDAGVRFDRVGGVSMGAFVGGLLACGHDSAAIDAYCYEEWVRRNPINDYTLPRAALIKGHKAEAMLDRVFGDVCVEELARSFYCASVNLRGNRLTIQREGPMAQAVGASMALPLIAPPLRRGGDLLIDGSLLDNLPLGPMSGSGEGPVLAIDVKGGEERPALAVGAGSEQARTLDGASATVSAVPARERRRLPSLPETMARIALLSSANTGESARRHADLAITVRVSGVGLLEFHQIDQARAAGRRAALAALEDPPPWLSDAGFTPPGSSGLGSSGRRTVVRV